MRTVVSVQTSLVCSAILKVGHRGAESKSISRSSAAAKWAGLLRPHRARTTGFGTPPTRRRARRRSDEWGAGSLSGNKMWISMGNHAKVALVFAADGTPSSSTAGLAGLPRRHRARRVLLARRSHGKDGASTGSDTASIALDDGRGSPTTAVLGEGPARASRSAMSALGLRGATPSPRAAWGICQGCVGRVGLAYSKERVQFGRPDRLLPSSLQGDDRRTWSSKTEASRMLVWRAGFPQGTRGEPNTTETSIAKYQRHGGRPSWCANTAIQVHGGSGYVDDPPRRALLPRRARDDAVRGDVFRSSS